MNRKKHLLKIYLSILFLAVAAIFCGWATAQEGKLVLDKITSPSLAGNLIGDPAARNMYVYLPPNYETSNKRYPVLYFLH